MPPQQEKPPKPVLETYMPPSGVRHPVKTGESWQSIARDNRIDAWDLIDFNFPGTKDTKLRDFQLATRQVNWYLSEYVGCQTPSLDRQNWAFTSGLTKGKGVWKGGVIYIPTPSLEDLHCKIISIPPIPLSPEAQWAISRLGIRLPSRARCLHPAELDLAKEVYKESLIYDDIYIA